MAAGSESSSSFVESEFNHSSGLAASGHPWVDYVPPAGSKSQEDFEAADVRRTTVGILLSISLLATLYVVLVPDVSGAELHLKQHRRLLFSHLSKLAAASSVPELNTRSPKESNFVSDFKGSAGSRILSSVKEENMKSEKDETASGELSLAGVIPHVFDSFTPTLHLSVVYRGLAVENGLELTWRQLTPFLTSSTISIGGTASELYTMAMFDPDAPSSESPSASQKCHWLWVNVPGGSSWGPGGASIAGDEVVEYSPPKPLDGMHHTIIALFRQPTRLSAPTLKETAKLSVPQFAAAHKLDLPVAAMYFMWQKDQNLVEDS